VFKKYLANSSMTSKQRAYMRALRDITEVRLRDDSGAAVTVNELRRTQDQFMPQVGAATGADIEFRQRNIDGLLDSVGTESGPWQRVHDARHVTKYGRMPKRGVDTTVYDAARGRF